MAEPVSFWAMGGYASYVWSAYGIAAVVIVANIAVPFVRHRALLRRIRREEFIDD
ncbi:heme exporter protein CcmD [uncultured Salinisphaera sp.]|uniref:heme exporter protein CcmD n=1 Tax=uncultured Salinisphaera sp. TaxID=359372 RepID=UPI0032B1BC89|tara:strand:+ start:347 stop:511 length:165 start_codon:yes stop_codon:yes gene_type:complete